jgi:hypothetical protein
MYIIMKINKGRIVQDSGKVSGYDPCERGYFKEILYGHLSKGRHGAGGSGDGSG